MLGAVVFGAAAGVVVFGAALVGAGLLGDGDGDAVLGLGLGHADGDAGAEEVAGSIFSAATGVVCVAAAHPAATPAIASAAPAAAAARAIERNWSPPSSEGACLIRLLNPQDDARRGLVADDSATVRSQDGVLSDSEPEVVFAGA